MAIREEISPIVSMKLGGCPPPQRGRIWQKLLDEVLEMPADGAWLQVEMREQADVKRARDILFRWHKRSADQLDFHLETVIGADRRLWIRKSFRWGGAQA